MNKCIICGEEVPPNRTVYCCDECAAEGARRIARDVKKDRPRAVVYTDKVCIDCGITYHGHIKSKRCPVCQREARLAADREYAHRCRIGAVRKLGSVDICERCGKNYTVTGGMQKYCPECAPLALAENDRKKSVEYWYHHKTEESEFDRAKGRRHIPRTKICRTCGKAFETKGNSLYCCEKCRHEGVLKSYKKYSEKRRRCAVCGKTIPADSGRSKYCSDECANAGRLKAAREYEKRKRMVEVHHTHCLQCGKPYIAPEAQRFCSEECKRAHKNDVIAKKANATISLPPEVKKRRKEVGALIRERRKQKNIRIARLSEMIGTDAQGLYDIEIGRAPLYEDRARILADVLEIPIDHLIIPDSVRPSMPRKPQSAIGRRIETARIEKGYTRRELAMLVGYSDRPYLSSNIYNIERGGLAVPKRKLQAFSDALGIPVEELQDGKKTEP